MSLKASSYCNKKHFKLYWLQGDLFLIGSSNPNNNCINLDTSFVPIFVVTLLGGYKACNIATSVRSLTIGDCFLVS